MVMEAPGSQNVGREFVRQYYTLLHEAPDQLHRFYSYNSSFVHGGVEKPGEESPPVTGQKEIHKKIMSLQFSNCHAKIRQVDSQSTVDNAIVIQVTGELSNDGEPMRRFMQTFVLASQSEKKFYVQNDIFRYQDEVFEDDMSDVDEDVHGGAQSEQYFASNGDHRVETEEDESTAEVAAPASVSTDSAAEESGPGMEPEAPAPEPVPEPVQEPEPAPPAPVEQPPAPVKPAAPAAPLSWSARVRGTGPSTTTTTTSSSEAATEHKPAGVPGVATGEKPQPQRQPRTRDRAAPTSNAGDGTRTAAPPRSAAPQDESQTHPDAHQVFIGNVRHQCTEKELIEHFQSWGQVVDVKINRKNRDTPHFGFVIFSNADDVQAVLNDQESRLFKGSHRLNVVRKMRAGDRGGSGPRTGPRGGGAPRGGSAGFRGQGGAPRGGRPAPSHRGGANGNFPARGSTPHEQRSS